MIKTMFNRKKKMRLMKLFEKLWNSFGKTEDSRPVPELNPKTWYNDLLEKTIKRKEKKYVLAHQQNGKCYYMILSFADEIYEANSIDEIPMPDGEIILLETTKGSFDLSDNYDKCSFCENDSCHGIGEINFCEDHLDLRN